MAAIFKNELQELQELQELLADKPSKNSHDGSQYKLSQGAS